jgi:hypothetical protein
MTDLSEKRDILDNTLWSRSNLSQYDISPLPGVVRKGLVAIILIASLSAVTTFALLILLTYRMITWRSHYSRYLGYNQYIILIYQLILADLQHALGYLISVKWLMEDRMTADSWTCFGQGMWLQLANPGSGLFVLAIAVHTYLAVMLNRKLSHRAFVACIISIWAFMVAMVIIPIAIHGREAMVPSGAWVISFIGKLRRSSKLKWFLVLDQFEIRTPSSLYSLLLDLRRRVWLRVSLCYRCLPSTPNDHPFCSHREQAH